MLFFFFQKCGNTDTLFLFLTEVTRSKSLVISHSNFLKPMFSYSQGQSCPGKGTLLFLIRKVFLKSNIFHLWCLNEKRPAIGDFLFFISNIHHESFSSAFNICVAKFFFVHMQCKEATTAGASPAFTFYLCILPRLPQLSPKNKRDIIIPFHTNPLNVAKQKKQTIS